MTEYQKRTIVGALPTGTNILGSVKITNGVYIVTVDASGRMETSVLSLKPDGTNAMPSMDVVGRAGYTYVTDGTNTMPTMDVVGRAGFVKITDGVETAAVNTSNRLEVASYIKSPIQSGVNTFLSVTNFTDAGNSGGDAYQLSAINKAAGNNARPLPTGMYGFNGTEAGGWDRLRADSNKYLYTTIGVELPAGTQIIGSVKISDGTETATVTTEGYLDVKTHTPEKCFHQDYAAAQAAAAIITPTAGKKIRIISVYVSTDDDGTDITLNFTTSGNIFFKLYTTRWGAAAGNVICAESATDETISLTCGPGTFVSIAYDEVT